ncbi:MAG: hypothetical protein E3J78_04085 [Candidatus Cloacimonadota bacterium]|nr:MAG: hypothetical protein E3J78_04085 [Candidatus Cloacimonadota bacterium]
MIADRISTFYIVLCMITVVLLICNCQNDTRVNLILNGFILPGKTTTDGGILIKFIWQGGG